MVTTSNDNDNENDNDYNVISLYNICAWQEPFLSLFIWFSGSIVSYIYYLFWFMYFITLLQNNVKCKTMRKRCYDHDMLVFCCSCMYLFMHLFVYLLILFIRLLFLPLDPFFCFMFVGDVPLDSKQSFRKNNYLFIYVVIYRCLSIGQDWRLVFRIERRLPMFHWFIIDFCIYIIKYIYIYLLSTQK